MRRRGQFAEAEVHASATLVQHIRSRGRILENPDHLDTLHNRIGDARYVLLGEASHGTAEFYTWRSQMSQRLIREKGF